MEKEFPEILCWKFLSENEARLFRQFFFDITFWRNNSTKNSFWVKVPAKSTSVVKIFAKFLRKFSKKNTLAAPKSLYCWRKKIPTKFESLNWVPTKTVRLTDNYEKSGGKTGNVASDQELVSIIFPILSEKYVIPHLIVSRESNTNAH